MTAIDFDEIFKQMVQEELERREGGNGMKSDPPAPKAPPSPQTKPSCPPPEIMCWENEVPTDVSKGDSFLYYHDFITEKEEKELTSSIYHEHYSSAWVSLKRRKLQQWGGTPSLENFVAEPLPGFSLFLFLFFSFLFFSFLLFSFLFFSFFFFFFFFFFLFDLDGFPSH